MRRCILECIVAAPVAGLQSYLTSFAKIFSAQGQQYRSPIGCKSAPLRNMRLDQMIEMQNLLDDGRYSVYKVRSPMNDDATSYQDMRSTLWFSLLFLWVFASWCLFAGIILAVYLGSATTWIGTASCVSLTAVSVSVRLLENRCLEFSAMSPSNPHAYDAVIFLGRRNSCLVLEGSRADIASCTGAGLRLREGRLAKGIEIFIRLSMLTLLLFTLICVPNGSTWDQVAFICLNLLGQFNNLLGRWLSTKRQLARLEKRQELEVETRTHVYALLLRKFGNGKWVDEIELLPGTDAWGLWRKSVVSHKDTDAKTLYEQCLADCDYCKPAQVSE